MNAEDTVMTTTQINNIKNLKYSPDMDEAELFMVALQGVAQKQADISFEAGKFQGVVESVDHAIEVGKEVGRKEVVEWAKGGCDCGQNFIGLRWNCWSCRQAKFKEWNIKISEEETQ